MRSSTVWWPNVLMSAVLVLNIVTICMIAVLLASDKRDDLANCGPPPVAVQTDIHDLATKETYCDEECVEGREREKAVSNVVKIMSRGVDPCVDFLNYTCGNWGTYNRNPSGLRVNGSAWNGVEAISWSEKDVLHGILISFNSMDDSPTAAVKIKYQECIATYFGEFEKNRGNLTDFEKTIRDLYVSRKKEKARDELRALGDPLANYIISRREFFYSSDFVDSIVGRERFEAIGEECRNGTLTLQDFKPVVQDICYHAEFNKEERSLMDRLYLRERGLEAEKINQVEAMMTNIQQTFVRQMEQSNVPWTNDRPSAWRVKSEKIQKDVWKIHHCIGFNRNLTDVGSSLEGREMANTSNCHWRKSPFQPQTWYNDESPSIEIPISLIQPPFFDPFLPMAVNYGSLGSKLGSQLAWGIKIAALWNLGPAPQCLLNQYSNFKNMSYFLGDLFPENIGLQASFAAFKAIRSNSTGKEAWPGLANFSDKQLFFIGFGQAACSDGPSEFSENLRVLMPLINSPQFAVAFDCPVGSAMNPKDKCILL